MKISEILNYIENHKITHDKYYDTPISIQAYKYNDSKIISIVSSVVGNDLLFELTPLKTIVPNTGFSINELVNILKRYDTDINCFVRQSEFDGDIIKEIVNITIDNVLCLYIDDKYEYTIPYIDHVLEYNNLNLETLITKQRL